MKYLLSIFMLLTALNTNKSYGSSPLLYEFWTQKEQQLLKIESEPENGKLHYLNLILDQNNDILSLKRTTKNSTYQSFFTLDQVITGAVSLAKMRHPNGQDLKPILLSCSNCDSTSGGDILIRYLRSGINPNRLRYRDFHAELRRVGDQWVLFKKDEVIKSIKLVSRKLMGQVVGIKKIVLNP